MTVHFKQIHCRNLRIYFTQLIYVKNVSQIGIAAGAKCATLYSQRLDKKKKNPYLTQNYQKCFGEKELNSNKCILKDISI